VETADTFEAEFFFGNGPNGRVVGHLEADQVPKDAGEFVGHGGDGFWRSQSCFPAAEAIPQIIFGAPEALGGQTEGQRRPTFDVAGFDGDDVTASDAVVRTEAQPGSKGFGGVETADEVGSQFGEQNQGGIDLEAGDLRQVDAGQAIELSAGVKGRFVALTPREAV